MHRTSTSPPPVVAAPPGPGAAAAYVGSSLRPGDLDTIAPGLAIFPPVRRGDLPAAVAAGYRTIAIIDGEFYQSLAVSPKEVLAALRAGCRVIGGASMGALRAVELAPHGMQPVGRIAQWYRRGLVTRDDDVALSYAHDEDDYRPVTIPMVNIRWLTVQAKAGGWLDTAARRRLSSAARAIHWESRTWPRLAAQARLAPGDTLRVAAFLRDPANDLKRLDALETLRYAESVLDHAPGTGGTP